MTGEAANRQSDWDTCIASAAVNDGAYSTEANATSLAGMGTSNITAVQKQWPLLDFYIEVTAGTVADGDKLKLYRVQNSSAENSENYGTGRNQVGQVTLTGATDTDAYIRGVENADENDNWQVSPEIGGASLTFSVKCRTRTVGPD